MTLREIPQNDLAHIRHENPGFCASETVLLVSTPRSGSTMLSTSIDPVAGCPMAEYFQPYEIIPYLEQVRRKQVCSGLLGRYRFSPRKYADYLANFRSGESRVLAVNFHASHIPIYDQVAPYLPKTRSLAILLRRDIVAQAVSYYIAGQTRKWSSNYAAQAAEPSYDRKGVGTCLETLVRGTEENIARFTPMGAELLFYEDGLSSERSFAARVGLPEAKAAGNLQTKRQGNALNAQFAARFREDIADKTDGFADVLRGYEAQFGVV